MKTAKSDTSAIQRDAMVGQPKMTVERLTAFDDAWARKDIESLMQFINEGIRELLDNGKIKDIVESYGVPFYPPFSS